MSLTVVVLSISCLSIACHGLQHGVDDDIEQIKEELRKQGELTNVLMKLVQDQSERIDSLSDHVKEQDMIIKNQAKRIADLENINTILEEVRPTSPGDYLEKNAEAFGPGEDNATSNIRETYADLVRHRLKERAVLAEGPVAFQAGVRAVDVTHIRLHEKIVFDSVILNLGGGYHSQFGLFIAPKPGIYIFSVTILSNANSDLEVLLMKNGNVIGGAYGNAIGESTGFDQGSITAVLQLAVGDEVYVENAWPDDTSLRGNGQSNFMGCLVFEL